MKLNFLTLQQGAAAGGVIIVLQLIAYIMGAETLLSPWLGSGRFIVIALAMVLACLAIRKDEGSLTYKRAVFESWVASSLASLMGVLFIIVMVTLDSQLAVNLYDATLAQLEGSMGGFSGMMTDEARTAMEGQTKWLLEPAGQLVAWAFGLIMWLLIAAIVGAIMKRPAPDSIR